jgi:hypothetical protein
LTDPKRTLTGVKEGVPLLARRVAGDLARDDAAPRAQAIPVVAPSATPK